LNDIFEEMFTGRRRRNHSRQAHDGSGDKVHVTALKLTLEELFIGCKKTRKVTFSGSVERTFSIEIPPGCKTGKRFKFSIPEASSEIHFVVQEKAHTFFERRGYDLHAKVEVPYTSLFSTYKFPLKHLNGKRLKITARGPFYPGKEIPVTGYGFKYTSHGEQECGDLIVKVELPFQRLVGLVLFLCFVIIALRYFGAASQANSGVVNLWGMIMMFLVYTFIAAA